MPEEVLVEQKEKGESTVINRNTMSNIEIQLCQIIYVTHTFFLYVTNYIMIPSPK